MKTIKITITGLLFACITSVFASGTEKTVKSNPDKVTIYLQGAQVYRTSTVNLVKGDNYIVFEGLENNIDPSSIQAGGNGNFVITEVQHSVKYPQLEVVKVNGDNKYQRLIRQLNDSLEIIGYLRDDAANRKMVLETEKNVLLNYSLYKGTSKKDSITFLKEGMSFLREKLNNIYAELLKIKKEEAKLNKLEDGINERIAQAETDLGQRNSTADNDKNKPDYRVIVTVSADAAITASLNVNYYVSSAGWSPFYDLRTNGADKGVTLTYKANVKQMTGVDWSNVKITLSTGNPKQSFTIPSLTQWYVDSYNDYLQKKKQAELSKSGSNYLWNNSNIANNGFANTTLAPQSLSVTGGGLTMKDDVNSEQVQFTYDYTTMDQNMTQAEFEIKLNYTIPSDNKNHAVSVNTKELQTKYVYRAVPKLDPTAFLTARVTGWEEMNLLPGTATVYFDGTYVGQTYLNTGTVSDTLELSLGQDKNVMVKRIKSKDKTKEKVLDNDKEYTYGYDILVRNGNNKSIDIEIQDQIPLSRSKDIVVEQKDMDGAEVDENTGIIKWKTTLKEKANKKLSFGFRITAPKSIPIALN